MINNIFIQTVDYKVFYGTIYRNMLPNELSSEFKSEELQVKGEFDVIIEDNKLLLVSLNSLVLSDGDRELSLNLDKLDYNEIYCLEDKLSRLLYDNKENYY